MDIQICEQKLRVLYSIQFYRYWSSLKQVSESTLTINIIHSVYAKRSTFISWKCRVYFIPLVDPLNSVQHKPISFRTIVGIFYI